MVEPKAKSHRFIAGGDLNGDRHLDDVNGGQCCHRFFDSIIECGFYACHRVVHGEEVQSFWGPQARKSCQDDHIFIDVNHASTVVDCKVIDNTIVGELSNHGPLCMINTDV